MTAMISKVRIEEETERLYALMPAHIRAMDAANGLALKALFQVLAEGTAEIDAEIDTLYDSMFAETTPESGLPDLVALVAAEPLRPLLAGSGHNARAFIANTIRYRRGKGTARTLESLAADVGGFGSVAVEYFMRLSRLQNLMDVRPERPGTAHLVPGMTAGKTATAFDTLPRLVDVRSIARAGGRHHIPNVGVHIVRPVTPVFPAPDGSTMIPSHILAGVPLMRPWPVAGNSHAGYFQLAAIPGRTVRLFNPSRRSQDDNGRVVECELGDRLKRLPLYLETEELRQAALEGREPRLNEGPWFDDEGQPFTIFLGRTIAGHMHYDRVAPSQILICNLEAAPTPIGIRPGSSRTHNWFEGSKPAPIPHSGQSDIRCAFDPITSRLIVAQNGANPDVETVRIAYATGMGQAMGAGPHDRNDDDVPFDVTNTDDVTNLVWVVDASGDHTGATIAGVSPVLSLDEALNGWATHGAGKRGFIVLTSCDRETAKNSASSISVNVPPNSELHIVSARWQPRTIKPGLPTNANRLGFIVRKERVFTIDALLEITPLEITGNPAIGGALVLDGLSLTQGIVLQESAVSKLRIRHCTIRSPGKAAIATTAALNGTNVAIESSVVGQVSLNFGGSTAIGALHVTNAIVSNDGAAGDTIAASPLTVNLRNVTILGSSSVKSIEATNVIFNGALIATRTQIGCVRYCVIAPYSTTPRRFRCQPDLAFSKAAATKNASLSPAERSAIVLGVQPAFLDLALDEPMVAMLHPMCSDAIGQGGEGETEIGAFANASVGLRMANIQSLFDDYLPFGLEAGLIDDTRSTAIAMRRNQP